ncbi:MAG: hypothetical protein ACM3KR_10255 [Deltaproteobacteria bacterium]
MKVKVGNVLCYLVFLVISLFGMIKMFSEPGDSAAAIGLAGTLGLGLCTISMVAYPQKPLIKAAGELIWAIFEEVMSLVPFLFAVGGVIMIVYGLLCDIDAVLMGIFCMLMALPASAMAAPLSAWGRIK